MIKVKCIGRDKNKAGVIKAYRLVDKNNNIKDIASNQLKSAIRAGQIEVINLQLTSDNRLLLKKTNTPDNKSNELQVANAIVYIERGMLCMGDSYPELVETIAESAGIDTDSIISKLDGYDKGDTIYDLDNNDLVKVHTEIYKYILKNNKSVLKQFIPLYVNNEEELIENELTSVGNIDTVEELKLYKALSVLKAYLLNTEGFGDEEIDSIQEIIDELKQHNITAISIGTMIERDLNSRLTDKYNRYGYYGRETEAEGKEYGQYCLHIENKNKPADLFSCGYAVFIKSDNSITLIDVRPFKVNNNDNRKTKIYGKSVRNFKVNKNNINSIKEEIINMLNNI